MGPEAVMSLLVGQSLYPVFDRYKVGNTWNINATSGTSDGNGTSFNDLLREPVVEQESVNVAVSITFIVGIVHVSQKFDVSNIKLILKYQMFRS